MCLLDGARYWQGLGAPSTASILTIWSSGPGHWALRSTIGYAAKLAVSTNKSGTPIFASLSGTSSTKESRRVNFMSEVEDDIGRLSRALLIALVFNAAIDHAFLPPPGVWG